MWTNGRQFQVAAAVLLAACSPGGLSSAEAAEPPFTTRDIATFSSPWALEFLPGSGLPVLPAALLSEREGRLWLVNVDTGEKQEVAGVPKVHAAGQGGLGDIAVRMESLGRYRVYLSFVEAGPDGASGAVLGYGMLDTGAKPPRLDKFKIIWRQSPKVSGNGHFSHRIALGPDGFLYLSSGDRQKFDPAQAMDGNLGKILRLTEEGKPAPGNPWASSGGIAAEFYSIGHRNPLGIAFASDGRLWETEMGPKGGDELNLIVAGRNYGWPKVSNGSHYSGEDIPDHVPGDGYEPPRLWWNPSISPGGLIIYTGDRFKGWKGDALIPALSGQALIRADIDGGNARKADQWDMGRRVRAVEQGPDGRLFILADKGGLSELVPSR